jgi:hypothetical protein
MKRDTNVDSILDSWFTDGPTTLPDRTVAAIVEGLDDVHQRGPFGLSGRLSMQRLVPALGGLAIVLVVGVLAWGLYFKGGGVGANPTPTPTPAPTVTPRATTPPPDPTPAALPAGPFVLVNEMLFGVRTTVTIPTTDWYGMPYYTGLEKNGEVGPPGGAKIVVYGGGLSVYGDPCAWESTRPDNPATSLDELVDALSAQASRDATAPEDVTVGGYPGKRLTLHVPEDVVFADCDGDEFRTLIERSRSGEETPHIQLFPGQISEVWVVDVDGTFVFFDAGYFAATPAQDVEEMRAIVESAAFEKR